MAEFLPDAVYNTSENHFIESATQYNSWNHI